MNEEEEERSRSRRPHMPVVALTTASSWKSPSDAVHVRTVPCLPMHASDMAAAIARVSAKCIYLYVAVPFHCLYVFECVCLYVRHNAKGSKRERIGDGDGRRG